MKRNFLIVVFGVVLVTGTLFLGADHSKADVNKSENETYNVSFHDAKNLGEIMREVKNSKGNLVAVSDSFTPLEGLTITDFYFIKPDKTSRRDITKGYQDARKGMVDDINKGVDDKPFNTKEINAEKVALPRIDDSSKVVNTFEIEGVLFRGSKEQVETFGKKLNAKNIHANKRPAQEKTTESFEVQALGDIVYVNPNKWAPKQGWLYTGDSSVAGERYATNYMWWNDVSGFSGQSFQTAYEHDFLLDSSNGKTYLDSADTFGTDYPKITYGASTLPEPYLDTRAFDNAFGELGYTIGSANANQITAGDQYYDYTYIRTLTGDEDTDNAKVQAQFSEYISGCSSPAFCIFSVSGTPITTVAPWDVPVPGSHFWVR